MNEPSMSDKYGEHRPDTPGDKEPRPGSRFELRPLKIERACQCPDHLMMQFSIEADVMTDPIQALQALILGEKPETSKQWVPVMRVLAGYN
jgi:hypothetical protein